MDSTMTSSQLYQDQAPGILGLLGNALPNNMQMVRQGINQSMLAPSFRKMMESMPRPSGVSFNSPNRAMAAAMGTADQAGGQAINRSMGLLGSEWENMFADLDNQNARMTARNQLNGMGQSAYLNNLSFMQNAQDQGRSRLMELLGPMLGGMQGNY